ncbi:ARPP-2 domain-containing protein [Allorhodopirellula heiligendammensis]
MTGLSLSGLAMAPPQVLGGIRLVPLIRQESRNDLRLSRRAHSEDFGFVEVNPKSIHTAYVPHGLVANWTADGGAVFGSQMSQSGKTKDGKSYGQYITARGLKKLGLRKMTRREGRHRLRFMPLHVAMEGLLALHFGGPDIAWTEYSESVMRRGLSPRSEFVVPGEEIAGLEDALRLFEVHDNQVGMLVFVAEALASAFVLPHPDDYASLHHTLLSDFYGELIWHYGLWATETVVSPDPIDVDSINNTADLRREVDRLRERWNGINEMMSPALSERNYHSEQVCRFKPFNLERFITDLDPAKENHIGEAIYADDGTLQYLKTYRMSSTQTRRAYLLSQLADHGWDLEQCAAALGCRKSELVLRLENAGFGYLLHQHVLDGARATEKRILK